LSINSLIAAIKVAGLNHKQIKQVLIADAPNAKGDLGYPLMRVWPNGFNFSNNKDSKVLYYKFAIGVFDRPDSTDESRIESCSDTADILVDIVASLDYIYRDSPGDWLVDDFAEWAYDTGADAQAGHLVELRFKKQYTRNFCDVPGRDFEFPAVNLTNESVIDEGGPDATYTSTLTIDES